MTNYSFLSTESEVWTLLKTERFDGSMLLPFPTHMFSSALTSLIETLATTGQHQVASPRERVRPEHSCGQTLDGEDEDHVIYGLMGNIESPLYIYSDKSKSMTYCWQCHCRDAKVFYIFCFYTSTIILRVLITKQATLNNLFPHLITESILQTLLY